MIPTNPNDAQDPARSYERAQPDKEAGMGRLDSNAATPAESPDQMEQAVDNAHPPGRQVNAEEVIDERAKIRPAPQPQAQPAPKGEAQPLPEQPDHSMYEEEPDGWDLAPNDIHNPREKRHPRTEGKGGVP